MYFRVRLIESTLKITMSSVQYSPYTIPCPCVITIVLISLYIYTDEQNGGADNFPGGPAWETKYSKETCLQAFLMQFTAAIIIYIDPLP